MQPVDVAIFVLLALASGRVAYSLVHDDIFLILREFVWARSAPTGGMIRIPAGDEIVPRPAQFVHREHDRGRTAVGEHYVDLKFRPDLPPRKPGFFGQVFECPYCMSFWTSLLACAAWLVLGDLVTYPALPLAVWGAANSFAVKAL